MAPKFKFTKEEILVVTLDFIRINGIKEISARTIARELNASTKVIFSLFGNMEKGSQYYKLEGLPQILCARTQGLGISQTQDGKAYWSTYLPHKYPYKGKP